jgi:phage shock protein C
MKKLYRSENDRMLCGVCGGIAEYCGIDSTLVRVGFALFAMACGSGILAYILAAVIIPRRYAIEKAEDPQQ